MSVYDLSPLLARLEGLRDPKYADFSAGLIPGAEGRMIGVRTPALRSIAREIARAEGWRDFLEASRAHGVYELRLLHAMVLGGARCPIAEKIALIDAFLPQVDNWAVCDGLCSSFKPKKDERDALFEFVCDCAASDVEFRKRFGLIMMMARFHEPPFLSRVMAAYRDFRHDGYYARMGAAWGLATLWLYARNEALAILRENLWDDFTHNKAIQKLRESYRVSDADKALVLTLKREKIKS